MPDVTPGRLVLSTLYFPRRSAWAARVDMLDRDAMSTQQLFVRLLSSASAYDVVALDGAVGLRGGFVDRVAAAGIVRRRGSPRVVITDATWGCGDTFPTRYVRRSLLRAMDSPRVTYCVLSTDELASFPSTWGVDPARVAFTPFYWTLPTEPPQILPGNGQVFAGGDSLRDHATVVAAARDLPNLFIRMATRWRPDVPVPTSVRLGPTSPQEFLALMGESSVVAVVLRPGSLRSAGQQTYLNAMALGKVVVVTDSPGVRDYIQAGRTGLIVTPGDPTALAEALQWATDPVNAAATRAMGERAHADAVARFGPNAYVRRLLELIDTIGI